MKGSRTRAGAHHFGHGSKLHRRQSLSSPAITVLPQSHRRPGGQWKPTGTAGNVAVMPGSIHLPEKASLTLHFFFFYSLGVGKLKLYPEDIDIH